MLHRRWCDRREGWVACDGTTPNHIEDSGVHRYDRVHGFKLRPEDAAIAARNKRCLDAERTARLTSKQKSHAQTVARFAIWERFCLVYHPEEEYTQWLQRCRAQSGVGK